ncbi:hypothetical protein ACFS07_32000 [Undibacterium arcticum]
MQTATEAVRLAADTRRAYFNAVAAQQTVAFMEQVNISAEAGSELAQRMARIGNFSNLDYERQQMFFCRRDGAIGALLAQCDGNP